MDKSIFAIILSVVGFLWGVYVYIANQKRSDWQHKIDDAVRPFVAMPDLVTDINAKLRVLEKQMDVFWKGVSFSSAQALHSPHTPELDRLLEKFQHDLLKSEREIAELKRLLRQEVIERDPDPIRVKFARDILTLIRIRFEIGAELIDQPTLARAGGGAGH